MVSCGDNVRSSVFVWCRVVTMSDLACLCSGDNARYSVFVWRLVVAMSDIVCLGGVVWLQFQI